MYHVYLFPIKTLLTHLFARYFTISWSLFWMLILLNCQSCSSSFCLPVETGPDSTRTYFWPAVNKRPTCCRPRYFLTRPEDIFFDPKGKKLKNLKFLGEIFQIQMADPTWVKKFWPGPITAYQDQLYPCPLWLLGNFFVWYKFRVFFTLCFITINNLMLEIHE